MVHYFLNPSHSFVLASAADIQTTVSKALNTLKDEVFLECDVPLGVSHGPILSKNALSLP